VYAIKVFTMASKTSSLSIFFKELKRRGVTRVATVYAVVGLGIIEAFDIIGGRFLLPDWAIRVIIIIVLGGFPVALILSWIYDITKGEGIVKTEALTPSEQDSLSVSWKPRWITIILLLVLMFTTTAFFIIPRPNALGFKQQDWILIADLENNTDDEVFDKSLLHALTVTIDQSTRINVYPRNQVDKVLKRMKMDSVDRITLPIAFEIAEREGIKAVLLLSISELGGNYMLSTSLLNPQSGETIRSNQISADGKEEILLALNKLANAVRKDLGESLKKIHIQTVPLVKATTHSLEALKCLSNAGYIDNTNYDAEIELLKEAIELDPEFALAHSNLAFYYYYTNQREKGEEHILIALGLLDRLTEKERLWIQAAVEGYRGNREESVLKWNIFLSQYPESYGAWFRLGYNYMMMNRLEESIEAFNRALEVYKDDDPSALVNIATSYSKLMDYNKAIEYYHETMRVSPDFLKNPSLNHEYGFTYAHMDRMDEARSVFEAQQNGNNEQKAMGLRSLALLSMYQGKYNEAIDQIHESILIYKTIGYRLSVLRNRLYLCNIYQTKGMQDEFHSELDQCAEFIGEVSSEPWWYLILGKMLIREGDTERAALMLEEIVNRTNEGNSKDEANFNLLKGEIELQKGNHSEALESLETANTLMDSPYYLESLANYYSSLGEWEKAISVYKRIINDYRSLGWEGQECWIRAHLDLGKAYEESGNKSSAIEYYTRLLEIWKEADPDLPALLEANSRMEKFQPS